MADKRTYIRVHDGMDEHPKIEPLSDRAFRALMSTWFWCSRNKTDGRVLTAVWEKRVPKKVRTELVDAGLAEVHDGYVQMHDYLDHQRSAEQIEQAIEDKRAAGRRGNHNRWHRDVIDPGCEFCPPILDPDDEEPPDDLSQNRSQVRSDSDRNTDRRKYRKTSPEDRGQKTEKKKPTPVGSESPDPGPRDLPPPRGASGPTAADAHRLVQRVLGLGYPAATLTDLAIRAAELLQQFDEPTVTEALTEWGSRTGIGPGVLPSLVADVVKRRNGHARAAPANAPKPSTTDQRVIAAQALKARYAQQPDRPALGAGT